MSDARLVRLAASGSDAAMAAIFERHHQALHRYCHSIVGNSHDASDALQNTMVKTLRALPGETRRIVLRPWLYRIAHNESISLLRARRPESELDGAAHMSDPAPTTVTDSRERMRGLTEDLRELTERQRGALLMRELGGLGFTEVAEALGTSSTAAKQSVYEARRALQAMEEGRAMDCDAVRRTISDGDRRVLRGMRMRGHLRACAGCHDFETAMRERPVHLAALITPLPFAAAAAMLRGIVGGSGGGGGGGLAAGLAGTGKTAAGFSLSAKTAAVLAVSATLAGGVSYVVPGLDAGGPDGTAPRAAPISQTSRAPGVLGLVSSLPRASSGRAGTHSAQLRPSHHTRPAAHAPAGAGKPAGTPGGKTASAPGGKPATTSGGRPAAVPVG
ncbi:MAG: hypothetical protein QOG15_3359, partial [Solirubrobacteraceae bacterium]|nr:hypothetical protein [Solirubrobacteraceae bacterium]